MDTRRLLTVNEAAAELGVSGTRVRQLIDQGRLPTRRVLGRIAVRRQDLELVRVRKRTGRPKKDAAPGKPAQRKKGKGK
jgi:excisionase family DNA binding protein